MKGDSKSVFNLKYNTFVIYLIGSDIGIK